MTMTGYWVAVALAVVGVIALSALALVARGRLRRTGQAAADVRVALGRRTEPLTLSLSTLKERARRTGP